MAAKQKRAYNSGCFRALTTKEFIRKAQKTHGNRYDYTQTEYKGSNQKVIINCSIHGLFTQLPSNHDRGRGCPQCSKHRPWSKTEIDYVIAHAGSTSPRTIADHVGREVLAVRRLACSLKLKLSLRLVQNAGEFFQFPNCGCNGVIPAKGVSDKFVVGRPSDWLCRVYVILASSKGSAAKGKYTPIPVDTPHGVVRKLMDKVTCDLCAEPLIWDFGPGKTPHLHHSHETGELYGFTHPRCNRGSLAAEIYRLRERIKRVL